MTMLLRTVYLEEEQVRKIIELSKRTRIPQAVLIREGIDIALAKHEKKLKRKTQKKKGDNQKVR